MLIDHRVHASWQVMSQSAAGLIVSALRQKPDLLLCAAAGASPTLTYRFLTDAFSREPEIFSALRVLALDEWGGLPAQAPSSCDRYLREHLTEPLQLSAERYVAFRSDAPDPAQECARVQAWLDDNGPIDLCVLGLGVNGHLALNEPAAFLQPHAHGATLSAASLGHPMLHAGQDRPAFGYTLGMADLLRARRVILLVSGEHKRAAMQQLMRRTISTEFPASFLWLHPAVTCFCDAAAFPTDPS